MDEWYENDAFWKDVQPVLFTEERWQAADPEVEAVVALTGVEPGAAVLDLGCGPGRHAMAFTRRGYRVTGVDRTAQYIEEAGQEASRQGLEIEWVCADMREFRRPDSFDLAMSMLTTFGYFDDPAEDRQVAEHVLTSLKPGGFLVIELMGKEVLARIFTQRDWQELPDGVILLEERELAEDWTRLALRWIVVRGERRKEHRFMLRLYSAAELKNLLTSTGFAQVEAYGSLQKAPYDNKAERLVVVARKHSP
jgi:SAM-dependent methyltransferase